jgi:hypothetical protein
VLKGVTSFSSTEGGGKGPSLSVLCIVAPSVLCCLSEPSVDDKGEIVLFEGSPSWNLANVVRGRWANPIPIYYCMLYICVTEEALVSGLDRYTS